MNNSFNCLVEDYILEARSRAAHQEELQCREVLSQFFKHLEKKSIPLPQLLTTKRAELTDYYLWINKDAAENKRALDKHLQVILRFLYFLESRGHEGNNNSNGKHVSFARKNSVLKREVV